MVKPLRLSERPYKLKTRIFETLFSFILRYQLNDTKRVQGDCPLA